MPEQELNNLARIGQLDKVPFSADLLRKMLATARTRLQDAQRTDNSTETRFDCAYTAIRAVADAALLAQGWRTSTSKPGKHSRGGVFARIDGEKPMRCRVMGRRIFGVGFQYPCAAPTRDTQRVVDFGL
jgi:hypothetical protein